MRLHFGAVTPVSARTSYFSRARLLFLARSLGSVDFFPHHLRASSNFLDFLPNLSATEDALRFPKFQATTNSLSLSR